MIVGLLKHRGCPGINEIKPKEMKIAAKKYKQETGKDPYNWEDGAIVGKTNEYVNWLEEVVKNCSMTDAAAMLPTDEDIMRWSKEFAERDIFDQADFRICARFMRLCMKGNINENPELIK